MHGNVKVTGHIIQPSDQRAKVDIEEVCACTCCHTFFRVQLESTQTGLMRRCQSMVTLWLQDKSCDHQMSVPRRILKRYES